MLCLTIFLLLLFGLDSCHGKLSALSVLTKSENFFAKTNFALGTFSRSKSVESVSRTLRGDDTAEVRESLSQALVTLAILDVGGGALVPVTENIIDDITKSTSFKATRDAWGIYNTKFESQLANNWDSLSDARVKSILRDEKAKVLAAFEDDVGKLGKGSNSLKHINKAKRWFKLKTAAKVLGPLFDTISVGVNSWALSTTLRDCDRDPQMCNHGAVAAATLSIASGVIGIGTFLAVLGGLSTLGPVGGILSLALSIGATLIELFWPAPKDLRKIEYDNNIQAIKELQRYSRLQLYAANQFMHENDIKKSDLYVVNQGNFPKLLHKSVLTFKLCKPRCDPIEMDGVCSRPTLGNPSKPAGHHTMHVCPYLREGYNFLDSNKASLGYDFYGFTETARSHQKQSTAPSSPAYKGSIVLVNTDKVSKSELAKLDVSGSLRGVDINTHEKDVNGNNDDLIALGGMKNLDTGEDIIIFTGGGNDALNIDGMIGDFRSSYESVLNADLGEHGHNSLSFLGLKKNGNEIKGVNYDASTGRLEFYYGDKPYDSHHVGKVKNVEVLGASMFDDQIKLYANKQGENEVDFTVFKFGGTATYEIDVEKFRAMDETRKFKIIDSTSNGQVENRCNGHQPVLSITNLGMNAVVNDILYVGNVVKIYAGRHGTSRKTDIFRKSIKRRSLARSTCSGEPDDGSHPRGGTGKHLLVEIAIVSKCPIVVKATNIKGECMMQTRYVGELDLMFFGGKKFVTDFSSDVTGSTVADVVYLKCPVGTISRETTINLRGGKRDFVVLRSDIFIEPCGIDGEETTLILSRKEVGKNEWTLQIKSENNPKWQGAGSKHIIREAEKIVNEYGELVFDLKNDGRSEVDLFDMYTDVTAKDIVGEKESEEVKEEMLKCIKNKDNIADNPELVSLCKTD